MNQNFTTRQTFAYVLHKKDKQACRQNAQIKALEANVGRSWNWNKENKYDRAKLNAQSYTRLSCTMIIA